MPRFAAADLILEGEYRVGHQEQLYIENNAMIAVPTDGGGVTVTGSLQCPYYVHAALKKGLGLEDDTARVVQAETGGGFGGKEEFPSVIALHAALLARKAQKPVRMIYDRHEDIAATTKRHPAIVRHRTGVTRDGTLDRPGHRGRHGRRRVLHAHAGRPVARRHPRRRPVPLPECPHPGQGDPDEHATERRVPRVRRARRPSSPPRRTSTGSPSDSAISPLDIRRRNVYREGDTTPTGQVLQDSVAGEEVLERAAEAAEFVAAAQPDRGRP